MSGNSPPTFKVEPSDLIAFATTLESLAGGTSQADAYRANNLVADDEVSGAFAFFRSSVESLNVTLDANMKVIRDTLYNSAAGLRAAASYYQQTDETTAAATDAIYDQLPG
ncbi:MAG: type VII secretion target [Propionibacteriaceae bacterium]|nr:type VII secretion target [Propionibacteriaceae bacterium]